MKRSKRLQAEKAAQVKVEKERTKRLQTGKAAHVKVERERTKRLQTKKAVQVKVGKERSKRLLVEEERLVIETSNISVSRKLHQSEKKIARIDDHKHQVKTKFEKKIAQLLKEKKRSFVLFEENKGTDNRPRRRGGQAWTSRIEKVVQEESCLTSWRYYAVSMGNDATYY